jgi:hypothetical protein
LPDWLTDHIMREWAVCRLPDARLANSYLTHPIGLVEGLRSRWPNPVTVIAESGRAIDDKRPLLLQCYELLRRSAKFATTSALAFIGGAGLGRFVGVR